MLNKVDFALKYIMERGSVIMRNQINKLITTITSYICTKMAFSVSASACSWSTFQPEEPKCLRK
ncbi:cyclic lactone autoinducer peptide [Clostridium sp.]|uniref:cyclic lactone autoinducer peptide n=1 Tax=Clostridium sp. TaxID=1506 RepID=UPI002633AE62|nr:cyclic lactone autoinducer peptide [Clostridium sp.]